MSLLLLLLWEDWGGAVIGPRLGNVIIVVVIVGKIGVGQWKLLV